MKTHLVPRLVGLSIHYRTIVIVLTVLITAFLSWFALKVEIDSDIVNLLPRTLKVLQLTEKYGKNMDSGLFLLAVKSKELFTTEKLQALEKAIRRIEKEDLVLGAIHPFNYITFENEGKKLKIVPMGPGGWAPSSAEELEGFKRRLTEDPLARNLVISKDGSELCAIFPVKLVGDYAGFLAVVDEAVRPLKSHYTIYMAGAPIIFHTTKTALLQEVPKFLALSFLIILVALFLSFRTLRSIVLPLVVVSLGTLWTTGTMVLLGFKLTVVSIMVPPLVLTLGSSYSIHVLNQYYREASFHAVDKQWIVHSVGQVNLTIILAALTTIIGFSSLATATLRQIKQFGIATSIGIFYCMILALFFLPATLSLTRNPKTAQKERVTQGLIARGMEGLSHWVVRWRYLVLGIVILIAVGFAFSLRYVQYQTNYLAYYRKSEKIIQDSQELVETFGGYTNIFLTLEAPSGEANYFLDPQVLAAVSRFEERLRRDPDISYLFSFTSYLKLMNRAQTGSFSIPEARAPILLLSRYFRAIANSPYGKSLEILPINEDFSALTLSIRAYDGKRQTVIVEPLLKQLVKRIEKMAAEELAGQVRPVLWGRALVLLYISETLSKDQIWSAVSSIALIFLVTALGFRSLRLGLITLIPLLVGIMLNFIFMSLWNIPFDVVTVMFSSVAMGVGIDDSIHLILQYRRQLKAFPDPKDRSQVLANTLKIAGRPIVLTSITLVAGLLVLLFSRFMPILYFGLLVSMALFTTTLGALIILPAVLSLHRSKK